MSKGIEVREVSDTVAGLGVDNTSVIAQAAVLTREGCEYINSLANKTDVSVRTLVN